MNLNRYQIRLNKTLLNYDAYLQCGIGNLKVCNTTSINDYTGLYCINSIVWYILCNLKLQLYEYIILHPDGFKL